MIGTLEIKETTRYDIIKKWASKSYVQKNARINSLITEIVKGDLAYDVLENKKIEAKVIADMILRK